MKVRVLYFASLADRAGTGSETVQVEPGTTVLRLWESLQADRPGLGDLSYRPMAACDMAYTDWNRKLDGVEEVAFLPPVSGG